MPAVYYGSSSLVWRLPSALRPKPSKPWGLSGVGDVAGERGDRRGRAIEALERRDSTSTRIVDPSRDPTVDEASSGQLIPGLPRRIEGVDGRSAGARYRGSLTPGEPVESESTRSIEDGHRSWSLRARATPGAECASESKPAWCSPSSADGKIVRVDGSI